MRRIYIYLVVSLLSMLWLSSPGEARGNGLKLLSDLSDKLELADQELSDAKKVIEEKSRDFQELIDKEVDEGFVVLDAFKKDLDRQLESLQTELGNILSEENLTKLKEHLKSFDVEVLGTIREEIITRLAERLDVSPEQLEQLTPILQGALKRRAELLKKFLDLGADQFEEFQKEHDVLWEETLSQVQDILSSEQLQGLESWRSELQEKIRQTFSKNTE